MTGTLAELALAAAVLLASHFGLSGGALRPALAARLGERGFQAAYSLIALAALAWLVVAYAEAPYVPLWPVATWEWFVPLTVMPLALVLLVAGVSQPNPTAVGQDGLLDRTDVARGALRITRNPVMWAIGLWALAHLTPNGDLASLLFFGSLAALALVGSLLIDHKNAVRRGADWSRFAEATSNLPFAAVLRGRQSLGHAIREIGWVRLGAALVLYGALLHGHAWLFGASALPPV